MHSQMSYFCIFGLVNPPVGILNHSFLNVHKNLSSTEFHLLGLFKTFKTALIIHITLFWNDCLKNIRNVCKLRERGFLSHCKNWKIKGADCHEGIVFRRQFPLCCLHKLIDFHHSTNKIVMTVATNPRHSEGSAFLSEVLQLVRSLYSTSQLLPQSAGRQQPTMRALHS